MTRDRGYELVIAAFVITVAAAGVLAFAPLTTAVTAPAVPADEISGEGTRGQPPQDVTRENLSLPEAQGWGEVAGIAVPVLLVTGMPLLAPSGRRARILRGVSTVLLFSGVVLGMLSFGIYLLPSAVLMFVATALALTDRHKPTGRRPSGR